MISPKELKKHFPISDLIQNQIGMFRQQITNIIKGQDERLLVVCGPCSIHDPIAALDYAKRLKKVSDEYQDRLMIVMRVYFEKPRTVVGWKGLINDPMMDQSFEIEKGLKIARRLLVEIANLNLPIATEMLDLNTPCYLSDLISWAAIGARTTEAQTHREMASGLLMPIGFKNGTDGNLQIAINAIQSAAQPHQFLGIDEEGKIAQIKTKGNHATHLILRGGKLPNYESQFVYEAEHDLIKNDQLPRLMIDCSHGNAQKKYQNQIKVIESIIEQKKQGNHSIFGIMLESHLYAGNQELNLNQLKYGVSITDPCLSWEMTEQVLKRLAFVVIGSK